ncbi:MAG: class B sortase [Oscillospiraceae bacterium]|nr:class B sortase [Oscillospiraceae bacterium]
MSRRKLAAQKDKLDIVLRQQDGETVYALARQTGYPVNEIRRWVRLYREKGEAGLKERRGSTVLLSVLLVVFAMIFAVAAVKLRQVRQERAAGDAAYAGLAESLVTVELPQTTEVPVTVVEREEDAVGAEAPSVIVDLDGLQAISPQGVGWIMSDDRTINYPVMQGTDNDYYLDHLADGTVNRNGSIFMDFRNAADLSDRNTLIYGHNMRNGAMFASLSLYSTPGYREAHPELLLIVPEGSFSLQVFAGCVAPGDSDLYQLSYRDDAGFTAYIEKVRLLSDFSSDVQICAQDKIVTLSTCSYDYDDARYLLFCKLVPMR